MDKILNCQNGYVMISYSGNEFYSKCHENTRQTCHQKSTKSN